MAYEGASKYESQAETLKKCLENFEKQFGCKSKYAAGAPGRVNLIGEHTDYNEGFVFPMVSVS